jgi:hypothetical protein
MIDFNDHSLELKGEEESYHDFPLGVKILTFIFSLILIFASVDYFVLAPPERAFTQLILDGFIMSKFFSLLDLVIIALSVFFIMFEKLHFKNATPFERILFILAIVCLILKMANPNNRSENPVMGLPLFSEINNFSYLLFFGTIICLPKKKFFFLVFRIFKFAAYIAIIRAIILLGLFAGGQSRSFFFGIKSCLLEGDTLLIFGLFQSVMFALFLATKDKKYLISWFILLLIQVFSSRRSPLFTSLFCNAIVFGFYYVRKMNAIGKMVTILVFVFTVMVLPTIVSNVSPKAKVYIDRYIGVFSTDNYTTDEANSDSGHFEQSQKTTESALKVGFWGVGYGNKLMLEGAFQINGEYFIHNVYAALWALHGVYMVIFYFLIILFVLVHFFKLLVFNSNELFHFALVKMSIIAFFLMYMNAMYYTTLNFLVSSKIEYFLILIICFILKFGKTEFAELLPYFKSKDNLEDELTQKSFVKF